MNELARFGTLRTKWAVPEIYTTNFKDNNSKNIIQLCQFKDIIFILDTVHRLWNELCSFNILEKPKIQFLLLTGSIPVTWAEERKTSDNSKYIIGMCKDFKWIKYTHES